MNCEVCRISENTGTCYFVWTLKPSAFKGTRFGTNTKLLVLFSVVGAILKFKCNWENIGHYATSHGKCSYRFIPINDVDPHRSSRWQYALWDLCTAINEQKKSSKPGSKKTLEESWRWKRKIRDQEKLLKKESQPLIIAKTPAEEQRLKLERLMRNPVSLPFTAS